MNALIKACKYSFEPNKLRFCGPSNAFQVFQGFIENPQGTEKKRIEKLLQFFSAQFPHLQLIAKENNLQPFNEEVIEAYWIGNDLLENVSLKQFRETVLKEFSKPGLLPKKIAQKKAETIVAGMLPHHSFHVLHINFVTGKLKPLIKNLSNCLVQWGKVLAKNKEKEKIKVKALELFFEANELKLREKQKWISKGFVENPVLGDIVSIHWEKAIEQLNKKQLKKLQEYTFKNLDFAQQ